MQLWWLCFHCWHSTHRMTPTFKHLRVCIKVPISTCGEVISLSADRWLEWCFELHSPMEQSSTQVPLDAKSSYLHSPTWGSDHSMRNTRAILKGHTCAYCCPLIVMAGASLWKEMGIIPLRTGRCCPSLWITNFHLPSCSLSPVTPTNYLNSLSCQLSQSLGFSIIFNSYLQSLLNAEWLGRCFF